MLSFTLPIWSLKLVLEGLVNVTILEFHLSRPMVMIFTPSNSQGPESEKA
jgi:hypothetical protein